MAEWNDLLRQARQTERLSRRVLSEQTGVSEDTIYSYESGRRQPQRDTLRTLLTALKLDGAAVNAILDAAGFELEPSPWLSRGVPRHKSVAELQQEVDTYAWPCIGLNERFEIIVWNRLATIVAELDFGRDLPDPMQRNLLRIGAMAHFRQRVLNWEAVLGILIGMYKAHHMGAEDLGEGSPYFAAVVADIMAHDSEAIAQLLPLWQNTPPRPAVTRTTFPVQWRAGDGTALRFNVVVTTWDEYDGVAANDWHPADAATWTWLDAHH